MNPGQQDESPMNKLLKSYLDFVALYTFGSQLVGRDPHSLTVGGNTAL